MWIVRLALRRTYTFVVAALLIAVLGVVSINRMSTDIFPNIDIPVVSVVWQYAGMPADEIEVLTGLQAGDTVVVHPGDDIPEGTVVEAVPLPK
jgi:Cu/Ag efflux pump CusA